MSNGFAPGCEEAKEAWPGGCQSCVSDDLREGADQPIDQRQDRLAVRHRQRAAAHEVVLHVDDDQRVFVARGERVSHRFVLAGAP